MQAAPDITIERIADQAIMRMAVNGCRHPLVKELPDDLLRQVVRRVFDRTTDRKVILDELTAGYELPISESAFYRFTTHVEHAGCAVHRDMLASSTDSPKRSKSTSAPARSADEGTAIAP